MTKSNLSIARICTKFVQSLIVLLTIVLVSTACAAEEPTTEPARVNTPTSSSPTEGPEVASPTSPAATPIVFEEAAVTSASATASPPTVQPTMIPATATPDLPSAPHVDVETVPYSASDCSPDYPCNDDVEGWENRLRVPPGFVASYFTRVDGRPTAMTVGPEGNLYVAVITGTIYTVDQAGVPETFFEGLTVPTGLAFQPGSENLFVSSRIKDDFVQGEGQVGVISAGQHSTVLDGLPCCYIGMHGPNGIAFGPDGFGYVGVGGRADHGEILFGDDQGEQDELHPLEASILRFSPDGEFVEPIARGFRNPYDIVFDARGRLYATDNGRDGDRDIDNPPDELHEVIPGGEHGYPYYECENCFGIPDDINLIEPIQELVPHSAAAGITAYLDDEFPGYYDDLFLVLWSAFEGAQKVMRVDRARSEISDFATGFAAPIDIVTGADGSLYVADFATGIIFKISYLGS